MPSPSYIYVASSWKNTHQPNVVECLRLAGYTVYDYRHPAPDNDGFFWRQVDPNWESWSPRQMMEAFKHPLTISGFGYDMAALKACDACVICLPSGNDAHLELGYCVGAGKPTFIYAPEMRIKAGMMYKMCGPLATDMIGLLNLLHDHGVRK